MQYQWLDSEVREGVAQVAPLASGEAPAGDFCEEFLDLLLRLQQDRAARVLLLTDAGGALDPVFDRRGLAERWSRGEGAEQVAGDMDVIRRVATLLQEFGKPTVAAIAGDVREAGFGLVMNLDVRLAAPSATFTATDMTQGLLPDWGLSHLLPRRIGAGRCLELLWSGRSVGGEEAARLGLVDRLLPAETYEDAVEAFVSRLADIPQPAMQLSRMAVQQSFQFDQTTALSLEFEAQSQGWESQETAEAMAAWDDGRRPEYGAAIDEDE